MLYYCLGSESPTAYGVAATDAQHMQTLRTPTSAPPPTTAMMPAGLITPPIYYAQPRLHLPDNIALAAAAAGGPPTYIQHHPHHHHHVEVHSPPFAPHSTPQSPATPSFAAPHNTNNNNNNGAAALFISPMLPPTAGQSPVVFGQVMAPTTLDGGFRLILPDGVVRATTAAATTAERMPPTVCLSGPLSFTTNAPPAMFQQQQQHVLATPVTPCSLSSFPDLTPPAVRPGYALGARYQGRVKRFNPNRGYGFLCASHQLLHISHEEAVVQQREDEDGKKDVVRLDGRFYKRVPVSLDDIFVHHCHLQSTTNNNTNNNTNNAINPPTPPASAMLMMSDAVGEKYSGPVLPVGSCVWFTVGTFEGRVQNKYQAIDVRVLPPCGALLIDDDDVEDDDALVEGSENNLAGSEASISSIATPGLSLGSGKKRSMAEEEALLITPHNRAQQHSDVNVNLHSPWGAGLRSPSKSFWDDVLRSPPDAHQASGAEAPTNTHTTSGDFLAVGTITSTQEVSTLHNNASNNIAGVKRTTTIATSSQNSSPLQRPRNMDEQRRLLSMKGFVSDAIVHPTLQQMMDGMMYATAGLPSMDAMHAATPTWIPAPSTHVSNTAANSNNMSTASSPTAANNNNNSTTNNNNTTEVLMPSNGNYASMFSLDAPASTALHYNVLPNAHLINPNMINGYATSGNNNNSTIHTQQQHQMGGGGGVAPPPPPMQMMFQPGVAQMMMPATAIKPAGQPPHLATTNSAPLMFMQTIPTHHEMPAVAPPPPPPQMMLQQPAMPNGWGANTIPTALLLNTMSYHTSPQPTTCMSYASLPPPPMPHSMNATNYALAMGVHHHAHHPCSTPQQQYISTPPSSCAGGVPTNAMMLADGAALIHGGAISPSATGTTTATAINNTNATTNNPNAIATNAATNANNSAASSDKRQGVPNGSLYRIGEWYEGVVKRYNPLRGFGFLTGITKIQVDASACEEAFVHTDEVQAAVARAIARQQQQQQQQHHDGDGSTSSPTSPRLGDGATSLEEELFPILANNTSTDDHGTVVMSAMQWYLDEMDQAQRLVRQPAALGDIFVHHTCISMAGFRVLPPNTPVRFSVEVLMNTIQAVDVVPRGGQWRSGEKIPRPAFCVSEAAMMELMHRHHHQEQQQQQLIHASNTTSTEEQDDVKMAAQTPSSSSSTRPCVMLSAAIPSSVQGRSTLYVVNQSDGTSSMMMKKEDVASSLAINNNNNNHRMLVPTVVEKEHTLAQREDGPTTHNHSVASTVDDAHTSEVSSLTATTTTNNNNNNSVGYSNTQDSEGGEMVLVSMAQLPSEWASKALMEVPMAAIPRDVAKELGLHSVRFDA